MDYKKMSRERLTYVRNDCCAAISAHPLGVKVFEYLRTAQECQAELERRVAADLERGRVRAAQSAEAARLAAYRAAHPAAPPDEDEAWECKRNAWGLCED